MILNPYPRKETMPNESQKLNTDTIYLLAEISGFLDGMSTKLDERRKRIALEYVERLRAINKEQLKGNHAE
jgi:hypothetical protein